MELTKEHVAFLEKLHKAVEKKIESLDELSPGESHSITFNFTVKFPLGPENCSAGCFKLSTGLCFCLNVGDKQG